MVNISQIYKTFGKITNFMLDILLGVLALLILVFRAKHLIDIMNLIIQPLNITTFSVIMQEITSFFMLFEFVMLLVRYIQEGHHIPVCYLILISVTAILRQLLVIHGEAQQTLRLSFAILLLVIVLYILSKFSHDLPFRKK
jgi:Predicted membrane protein